MPPVLGYGAVVGLALYLAVYPMLAAGLAWRLRGATARPDAGLRRWPPRAAWIVTEWLRATMFTGYAGIRSASIWLPVQPVAALARVGRHLCAVGADGAARRRAAARRVAAPLALSLPASPRCCWRSPLFSYRAPPRRRPPPTRRASASSSPTSARTSAARTISERDAARADRRAVGRARPRPAPDRLARGRGATDYVEDGYPLALLRLQGATARAVRAADRAACSARATSLLIGGTALQFDARRRAQRRAANSVFALDARGAHRAAATTRRISSPTANICRCAGCSSRSASRGWCRATSISPRARARARSTCPASARSGCRSATRSSFRARSSIARTARDCCSTRRTTPGSAPGARRSIWRRRGCARSRKGCRSSARPRPASPR